MCRKRIKLDVITETDVYKWDPDELPGQSMLKTGDRQWFFFSPRDRRYPNGGRSNRGTRLGYWKATGKDRTITCNSRAVGVKKTLVFYRGRAPNGDRTDWVMHEYTLDEEELKRCENVQDYYALYKVFKKSGPGPKNGEQYGAPFKEEEWEDEEAPSTNELVVTEKHEAYVAPVDDHVQIHAEALSSADDIEEFMKRMLDEPLLPEEDINIFADLLQAVGGEDSKITLVEPSFGQAIVTHSTISTATNGGQYGEQAGFGFTQMVTLNPQEYETPEVTGNWDQAASHVLGEEEGFLEIVDLDKELATSPFVEKPVDDGSLQLYDYGDLFHDADMFLHDIGHIPNSYNNGEGNAMLSLQYTDDFTHQTNTAVGNQQMWTTDQRNDFTPLPLSQAAGLVPSSGVANELLDLHQSNKGEDGADASWMSSMLWSFVESIPTTPASASESPLVNRAFERMSSFSRLRLNARINDDVLAADNSPPIVKRTTTTTGNNKKKGFVLLSIIGALLAILWVFLSTVRIMGRVVFA
jgi:hypothetical protein